jgi:hypothetical protein
VANQENPEENSRGQNGSDDRTTLEPTGNTNDPNRTEPETEAAQPEPSFSQASQVGRAQSGGSSGSAGKPGETTREGWPAPDQADTPTEWPEPTID